MKGTAVATLHAPPCTLTNRRRTSGKLVNSLGTRANEAKKDKRASFMSWTTEDVLRVAKIHWMPCLFGLGLLFFMAVEYTLRMVPPSSEPFDLGFVATRPLHRVLAARPELNTLLAALNTVGVGI